MAQLHQKCDSESLGFLRGWFIPICQENLVPSPVGPEPSQSKALLETEKSHSWVHLWAQPNPDYTLGIGQSPASICELEQDLGFEKDRWCFPGLTLEPRHHQALLDHPGLSRVFWRLSGCLRKRSCVSGQYFALSPRVSSGLKLHTFKPLQKCGQWNDCFYFILQNTLASFHENYESKRGNREVSELGGQSKDIGELEQLDMFLLNNQTLRTKLNYSLDPIHKATLST